ncbi:MAG: DAK2 domain-containing protein, partial [Acetatifactor sp.]|nr:DAK2 domain-containing protein [Acetatifactor sp.]
VETAYKAVMKPKEGTILTVAKGGAEKAKELAQSGMEDLEQFFSQVLEHARYVLSQTPELLPVLKQAGVVDSGGQGLVEVMSGAYDAFLGKEIDYTISDGAAQSGRADGKSADYQAQAQAEIKFGYCTEFIIMLSRTFNIKQEMDFKAYLESIGDSIVCVADEDVVKVHVHTNDPGLAIQKALKYGQLSNLKIDNMRLEHQEKLFKMSEKEETAAVTTSSEPLKPVGFLAVSVGDGINEIFRSLGVDYVIEGGQTMNPSTADILDAVDQVNAETIFILPNNKNIILAANQAAELMTDKHLLVIPTKTIPQGITAVINYVPEMSLEDNELTMMQEIGNVKSGQVTYAVRDTMIDDKEIKQGDYMGIGDAGILSVGQDMLQVTRDMVGAMVDETSELISIYYGSDVQEEAAQQLRSELEEAYGDCDIELQYGGQPIYYYVISVE